MTARTIDEAVRIAQRAEAKAESAANHALSAHQSMGRVAAELSDVRSSLDHLGDKVDGLIDDQRTLIGAVRRLNAVEEATRAKVDSFHDLSELDAHALTEVQRRERARRQRREVARRWTRRALLAFVLGAATVGGGTAAIAGLRSCGLPVPRELEVAP